MRPQLTNIYHNPSQSRTNLSIIMLRAVRQPSNLQRIGRAQEGGQLRLRNVHLPHVHELQQRAHVRHLAVAHEDYGVRARVVLEGRWRVKLGTTPEG